MSQRNAVQNSEPSSIILIRLKDKILNELGVSREYLKVLTGELVEKESGPEHMLKNIYTTNNLFSSFYSSVLTFKTLMKFLSVIKAVQVTFTLKVTFSNGKEIKAEENIKFLN